MSISLSLQKNLPETQKNIILTRMDIFPSKKMEFLDIIIYQVYSCYTCEALGIFYTSGCFFLEYTPKCRNVTDILFPPPRHPPSSIYASNNERDIAKSRKTKGIKFPCIAWYSIKSVMDTRYKCKLLNGQYD
jgi:hypothetical protein